MPNNPLLRSVALTLITICIFLVPQPFLSADQQVELWSGGLTVACLWGIWRYGPTSWRAFREGSNEPWHYGIMAIVILMLFIMARQFYQVLFIRLERPEAWYALPISAFIVYGIMIAVIMFSIATRTEGEKPSVVMGWITAIAAALAIFMSSLFPFLISKGSGLLRFFNAIF